MEQSHWAFSPNLHQSEPYAYRMTLKKRIHHNFRCFSISTMQGNQVTTPPDTKHKYKFFLRTAVYEHKLFFNQVELEAQGSILVGERPDFS